MHTSMPEASNTYPKGFSASKQGQVSPMGLSTTSLSASQPRIHSNQHPHPQIASVHNINKLQVKKKVHCHSFFFFLIFL